MTVTETRTAISTPSIPRPRSAAADTAEVEGSIPPVPELPPAAYPWPEPWRSSRGARPRSEYWDVGTASWHSRGPTT